MVAVAAAMLVAGCTGPSGTGPSGAGPGDTGPGEMLPAPYESREAEAPRIDPGLARVRDGERPRAARDPRTLALQITVAERAVRDPSSGPELTAAGGRLAQVAYRAFGDRPDWDAPVLAALDPDLHDAVTNTRDAILGAANYLAANGGADEARLDNALHRYNNDTRYVHAVRHYAALMQADERQYLGFHAWPVYHRTQLGDVLLPTGYESPVSVPAERFVAENR